MPTEGTVGMLTIGVDPHKQTHSAVAVDELGVQLATSTRPARKDGFGALLAWSRSLPGDHVWVVEDCGHVSGPFERFLIDHGETVVRLPPRLMADARRGVRERGKSDPSDAPAVARAAMREGLATLPAARLAGPEPAGIDVELEYRTPTQAGEKSVLSAGPWRWIASPEGDLHASLVVGGDV